MAADITTTVDYETASLDAMGGIDLVLGPLGYNMTIEDASIGGGGSGLPPRPSSGFLYPRRDC